MKKWETVKKWESMKMFGGESVSDYTLPSHLCNSLQPTKPLSVTPSMARKALLGLRPGGQIPIQQHQTGVPALTDVPSLLMYCLSDVLPNGGIKDEGVLQLVGLPLLPLLDGTVATIQAR